MGIPISEITSPIIGDERSRGSKKIQIDFRMNTLVVVIVREDSLNGYHKMGRRIL